MPHTVTAWASPRARVAALARDRAPDDPELIAARRELAESPVTAYVSALVDGFPPLTAEQRDRIAGLLRSIPARARRTAC